MKLSIVEDLALLWRWGKIVVLVCLVAGAGYFVSVPWG